MRSHRPVSEPFSIRLCQTVVDMHIFPFRKRPAEGPAEGKKRFREYRKRFSVEKDIGEGSLLSDATERVSPRTGVGPSP